MIVATGGVRRGPGRVHARATPAIGVGPGNVPVLVDASADLAAAAKRDRGQQELRQLDPVHERVRADRARSRRPRPAAPPAARGRVPARRDAGARQGAATCCSPAAASTSASSARTPPAIAAEAGIRVPATHPGAARPVRPRRPRGAARAREAVPGARPGPGADRAAGHRRRPRGAADRRRRATPRRSTPATRARSWTTARPCEVLRVAVNAGNSLGSSGLETNLAADDDDRHRLLRPAPRSARTCSRSTSCTGPRLAYNSDPAEPFGDFAGLSPWERRPGRAAVPVRVEHAEAGGGRRVGPGDDRGIRAARAELAARQRLARGDPAAGPRGAQRGS